MKKCICGILAICLLTILAVPVFAALPEGSGVITSSKNISGSEFSPIPAIASKLDSMFAGNIGLYADKNKTKLVDAALGTRNVPNNGKWQYWGPEPRAGTSCFAYANAFYGYFYDGVYPHQTLNANHQKIKANGKITYSNFVKWGVRNDAAVYIREGNHSVIVLHYDKDYITYIDGNGDGKGLIAIRKEPWKRMSGTNIYNQKPSLIVQPKTGYFSADSMQKKQPVPCTKGGSYHNWDAGTVTKNPTCGEKGIKIYTCLDCKKSREDALAKTDDHSFGEWSVVQEASCGQAGAKISTCTVCGKEKTKTIKALGHDYGKAVTVREATIFSGGIKEKTCSRCQKIKKEKLPCSYKEKALNITLQTDAGVFPKDTQISVTRVEEIAEAYGEAQMKLREVSGKIALYDICAQLQESSVQPEGSVTLEMGIPEGFGANLAVYAVADNRVQVLESVFDEENHMLTVILDNIGRISICDLDVPWEPEITETTQVATEQVTLPVLDSATEPAATMTLQDESIKQDKQYIILIAVVITAALATCITALIIRRIKKAKTEMPID